MIKKLLMTGLIGLLIPIGVNATTFKDGDKTYNLKEVDINCNLDNLSYSTVWKNNSFLYENSEDGDNQTKILDDGTCVKLSGQELLDYYNNTSYYSFEMDKDYNRVIVSVKFEGYERDDILIPTHDKEIVQGKDYYEIEIGTDGSFSSGPAESGNINNYYEKAKLMLTKSIKEEPNKTYYEVYGSDYATEVINYDENKALNYYVLSDGSVKETKKTIVTLPDMFKNLLARARYDVIKSTVDDNVYIIVSELGETKWDVYDIKGNIIFEDIDSMVIVNSLFAVTSDNLTKFYNFDKNLVYELKDSFVDVSKVNGNISTIIGKKAQKDTLYILELEEIEESSVPKTSDNIVTMFIIGGLSLAGIVGVIIYSKKKKIFN